MSNRLCGWCLCVTGAILVQVLSLHHSVTSAESDPPESQKRTIALSPLATQELESPLFLTHARDGSGRLFVVEQPGRIRIVEQGELLPLPFLDIHDRILSGGERGLLGLAFHPDFRRTGKFYVNYTRKPDGATVVAEYRRGPSPHQALRDERALMTVLQPYANHNGGMVAFGPDGYLYIGLGDGGGQAAIQTIARRIHRSFWERSCGSMLTMAIPMAFHRIIHLPQKADGRRSMR